MMRLHHSNIPWKSVAEMTSEDMQYEQQDQANERYIMLFRVILSKLEEGILRVNEHDSDIVDDNCEEWGYMLSIALDVV